MQYEHGMNKMHILTWQQAFEWSQLERPKYIMFGNKPNTKEGKVFFAPFINAGLIDKNHLKYSGAFRLTKKGKEKYLEFISKL